MEKIRIVPAFDVPEDAEPGLNVRGEPMLREQLDIERREEALGHRVVVRVR